MPGDKAPEPSKENYKRANKFIVEVAGEHTDGPINIVPSPVIMPKANKIEEEKFFGDKIVNGIHIKVFWSEVHEKYMIFLPQIEEDGFGLRYSALTFTKNSEEAKMVFDNACSFAQTETDVNGLYDRLKFFLENRPFNYDEKEGS